MVYKTCRLGHVIERGRGPGDLLLEWAAMRVFSQFQALFPIRSDHYAIELVGALDEGAPADLVATVQTIVWEGEGAARTVRDIRQQEVVWLLARHREDPRVPAYLTGWADALRFVLARHAELAATGELPRAVAQRLEFALPHELLCPQLLDLRRPQTAEAFTEALLVSDKRLGRFLP